MPELPEVETVKRGLETKILNKRIASVDQRRPDLRIPFPPDLKARLERRKIVACRRRAKYVLIDLDDGETLVLHLGMAGRVVLYDALEDYEVQKHDHLVVALDDGTAFIFNDPRRFGMVMLAPANELESQKAFAAIGPEPLGNHFHEDYLYDVLKKKKTTMKAALLDQRVVAGLGNIYVCEALHFAGISPRRRADKIKRREIAPLIASIRKVLHAAIAAGGSSLKDYRQTDGELGYFQHNFAVYDRESLPCPACTCDIEKTRGVQRIVQSGRSTFYCPAKQV